MGDVIKETSYFDLHLDLDEKVIKVVQRWKYNWIVYTGEFEDWSYVEKKNFHDEVDRLIWKQWSYKYVTVSTITTESYFPEGSKVWKTLDKTRFKVVFDIKWVTKDPHWNVNIRKVTSLNDYRSHVSFSNSTINLTWLDTSEHSLVEGISQNIVNHEYGHTIGADDEYSRRYVGTECEIYEYEQYFTEEGLEKRFKHASDQRSLMNIGNELRSRFISNIDTELDDFFTGVEFHTFLE